jgi:cytoskeletal protein CcmA (bactofilin family)
MYFDSSLVTIPYGAFFPSNIDAVKALIEGTVAGTVHATNSIIVGTDGKITNGDVIAKMVVIYGTILGNVECETLVLHPRSCLIGDI